MRKCILRRQGHVERKGMSIVRRHMLGWYGGVAPVGRWKKTWQNMRLSKVDCLGTATIG